MRAGQDTCCRGAGSQRHCSNSQCPWNYDWLLCLTHHPSRHCHCTWLRNNFTVGHCGSLLAVITASEGLWLVSGSRAQYQFDPAQRAPDPNDWRGYSQAHSRKGQQMWHLLQNYGTGTQSPHESEISTAQLTCITHPDLQNMHSIYSNLQHSCILSSMGYAQHPMVSMRPLKLPCPSRTHAMQVHD